jgi:hypothetical protein
VKAFDDYISAFEKSDLAMFSGPGKLWIDNEGGKRKAFDEGKPLVEPRLNDDVANGSGSIHHYTGVIRVPGGTIEQVRAVMQDYPRYVRYFPPDVVSASGEKLPDSTAADEHFRPSIQLAESTLWIKVGFRTQYDTHYLRYDQNRWVTKSSSLSIRELLDAANPSGGFFPAGDDHGFLWKTNTYWFARVRDGGVDLEANSITLSRPAPTGFGWYGTKRAKETVDKLLRDVKAAMALQH